MTPNLFAHFSTFFNQGRDLVCSVFLLLATSVAGAQEERREVVGIPEQKTPPAVKAIAPIDNTNFFFLNDRGQVGVAKFTPGLSLIGWENYSTLQQQVLPSLAVGKNRSIITAGYDEVTQIFDTNEDSRLDFYQALIRDWPGRKEGVTITAGPVSDSSGKLYFALSNYSTAPDVPGDAMIMSWDSGSNEITPVTASELPVVEMAINEDGLLAAQLELNSFKDGYYISLTDLPSPAPAKTEETAPVPEDSAPVDEAGTSDSPAPTEEADDTEPETEEVPEDTPPENTEETATPEVVAPPLLPRTLPSLIIPSELTGNQAPSDLCFVRDKGVSRLLVTCPLTRRIIEVSPSKAGDLWQGSIVLRETTEQIVETLCATGSGELLGGGPGGFYPISDGKDKFRIKALRIRKEGIEMDFSHPVDRFAGIKPESYNISMVQVNGGVETKVQIAAPVVESDGFTVFLQTDALVANSILRVKCPELPSESGENLLSPNVYYSIHGL